MAWNKNEWINILDINQSVFSWSLKKYECPEYMFAEKYDQKNVKEKILNTHRIKDAVEQHIKEKKIERKEAYAEASKIIEEIAHTFSIRTIRFMAFSIMNIMQRIFKSVLVNKKGVEKFRECSKLSPVVLVPTHNSYFDFIIASVLCFALDLPLPAIVAGQDFLGMVIINHLLRSSGAFYMRRSFAADVFYRSIFTEYVQQILQLGERPIEFFPEGTRSRCGKALQPKVGLLSMVLESFFHGFVQDVKFIPLSISYEKITEEQLYLFELLGIPKPKESLSGLLKARSILNSDYGNAVVNFGEVMSIREYCYGKIDAMDYVHTPRCERHLKIFGRDADEMKIAKYFGEKIVFKQQAYMTIFPRAVVAAIMLQDSQKRRKIDDLSTKVDTIGKLLKEIGCLLFGFEDILLNGDASLFKAIDYSNVVLKHSKNELFCSYDEIIDDRMKQTELFKAFTSHKHQGNKIKQCLIYIYLSFQRNRLLQNCFLPALLLHAIDANSNNLRRIKEDFKFLCDLFKIEFIFDPDITLEELFTDTLKQLENLSLIETNNDLVTAVNDGLWKRFLKSLIQPHLDGYLITSISLYEGTFDYPASVKDLSNCLQLLNASFLERVDLETYESISLHTLSNIVTSYSKRGLLRTIKNDKFQTLINGKSERLLELQMKLGRFTSAPLQLYLLKSKL